MILIGAVVRLPADARPTDRRSPVGRVLGLREPPAVVQAVSAPARVARVAAVKGSKEAEAWALGFSQARKPGWDQVTPAGQTVLLRYLRRTGWTVAGAPVDTQGKPVITQLAALDVTPEGQGWAVGNGMIFRRDGSGDWRLDPGASAVTRNQLYDVSLGSDAGGAFGYAVGANLTLLKLTDAGWQADVVNGSLPTPNNAAPSLVSVTTVDRDRAWAVGTINNALLVMRRTASGWSRQLTGKQLFDSAPSLLTGSGAGSVNQFAHGTGAAANTSGAWLTGELQPVDATKPAGDPSTSDRRRPFALRFEESSGTFTSYCPRIYQASSSQIESTIDVCDRPFPFATGDLPAVDVVDGPEAFAGGFGLFHFVDGVWRREANVVGYVGSLSFASPREGWMSTPGNVFSVAGLLATSSSTVLGHWTTEPDAVRIRRWPQPARTTLESVSVAPGSSEAFAVGATGTILRHTPGIGWDRLPSGTAQNLHGVAWSDQRTAWAVGDGGTILRFDGDAWAADPASGSLTRSPLRAVAFAASGRGWAVGAGGTILRFDGRAWSTDPASRTVSARALSALAVAGGDAIAAGDQGTVLVSRGGGPFVAQADLPVMLRSGQEGRAPNLLSVAGLPDGTAFVGGARSVLLERRPGGDFVPSAMPAIEGSIHSLAARRVGEKIRLLASVGTGSARYSSVGLADAVGSPFAGTTAGWMDLGAERPAASTPELDAPAQRDAVYGFAFDAAGTAWAVGGIPPDVADDDGHARATATGSVWRIGLDADPTPSPAETAVRLPALPGVVGFAFLGDSACATGSCAAVTGSGSRADVVVSTALQAIDSAARDGAVSFVALGGDMRREGSPDELEPVRGLMDDVRVPVYAALGDRDLAGGLPLSGYYQRVFAGRPAPWGTGRAPGGFLPVRLGAEADRERASTHYAFDYRPAGRPLLRMVFLDTSRSVLAAQLQLQNPPEDQTTWLAGVLADARSRALPVVVVMHQPFVAPANTNADAAALTPVIATGPTAAVLASQGGTNRLLASVPGDVPIGIFGGAGGPLDGWRPEAGAYHSWQFVTIEPEPGGRAAVSLRSMPVLESVALSAPGGRSATAGGTLRFSGLGRLPDVGGAHAQGRAPDPAASSATYMSFPFAAVCGSPGAVAGACTPADVVVPWHRFACDDPSVCAFVREDPSRPGLPYRDPAGRLVADQTSGLMCAFKPGSATVTLEAGVVGARLPVTVTGGEGPCIPGRLVAPPPGGRLVPASDHVARVEAPRDPRTPPNLGRTRLPDTAAVGAVLPPIINPAPAPPAGGGGQREEQREAASERADMRALPTGHKASAGGSEFAAAGAAGLALMFAAARRRRVAAAAVPLTGNNRRVV